MSEIRKSIVILIVSVCSVPLIIGSGAAVYFAMSPDSVSGDWELLVNPELPDNKGKADNSQRVYYSFSEPGKYGDGVYKTYYDGGVEEGAYKLTERDGKRLIDLGVGELEYKFSGSALFGNARLTITYPEKADKETGKTESAQDYVFGQAKAPDYEGEAYDFYTTDESLLGDWITAERSVSYYDVTLPYQETVRFKENGIMTIHYESRGLALDRYMYYAYTAHNGKLTFSPVTNKAERSSLDYVFDDNGNLNFINDKTSSSVFSDQIFSDATFYLPDRLPKSNDKGLAD